MATITWLDKIDGLDLLNPQKNINAADMNQIKSAVNTNDSATTAALALKASITYVDSTAASKVADTINNGTTTVAPSQNAVFDALALKADSSTVLASFVENEVPSGTINGVNTAFIITYTPVSGSVKVYWNGMRMKVGVGYTISDVNITMTLPPETGDTLVVDYRK